MAVSFPLYSPEHKIEVKGKVRDNHMIRDKEDQLLFEQWLRNLFVDPNTSFLDFQTFRLDVFEYPTHYLLEAFFEKKHVINICSRA